MGTIRSFFNFASGSLRKSERLDSLLPLTGNESTVVAGWNVAHVASGAPTTTSKVAGAEPRVPYDPSRPCPSSLCDILQEILEQRRLQLATAEAVHFELILEIL